MKKTSAKICTISDLIQWHQKKELELSPKYQRNNVWNEIAKAYLMDTIIRGLPIPPIFMRNKIDVSTKTTFREIIDGQQRVRAIIEFIMSESYALRKSHNKEFGGKYYSDLDTETQEAILEYEIMAEIVVEKDESVIYDMFARLNSNNMVLNRQEIRNSKYWGEFKVIVYQISSKYRDFFLNTGLLSDKDCARMRDSELINSLLIVLTEGIVTETPTYVDKIYAKYDKTFLPAEEVEEKITTVMRVLIKIYEYLQGMFGCFGNKNYFFTLFCVIVNQLYGINGMALPRNVSFSISTIDSNMNLLYNRITRFISEYDCNINDKENEFGLYAEYSKFAKNHTNRTTSKKEREERIKFLNDAIGTLD